MILKSFYHKKSTKVYLIIITITIIAIMSMFLYKNKIIKMENIANEYSYVFLYSKKEVDKSIIGNIEKDKNFREYCEGIAWIVQIKVDDNLTSNEIIIPNYEEEKIGDIYIYREKFEFIVKDKYDSKNTFFVYVSREKYNELCDCYKNYGYIIYVNNWYKRKDIMNKLSENSDITVSAMPVFNLEVDYDIIIYEINIFIKIIFTVFVIVNIIVIFNIIHDQKYKIGVYKSLGYNKSRINRYQFINIISLYITSSIVATIISYLLYLFIFN